MAFYLYIFFQHCHSQGHGQPVYFARRPPSSLSSRIQTTTVHCTTIQLLFKAEILDSEIIFLDTEV